MRAAAEDAEQVGAVRDRVQPSEFGVVAAQVGFGAVPGVEGALPGRVVVARADEPGEDERGEGAGLDLRVGEAVRHLVAEAVAFCGGQPRYPAVQQDVGLFVADRRVG